MGRLRRKGNPAKNKASYKAKRTRHYKRDADQIVFEDLIPEITHKLLNQPAQEDMPGLGQHYCVTCARYFISSQAKLDHNKTKEHKKRFKTIQTEEPYTIEEAERAGGLRAAKNAPKRVRPAASIDADVKM
ncbi:hypothetical protein FGO68_gene15383 [Halteria grandinella]|uniref:C2H2-type domain-containing protein n=1 Tax=Halteria grandinella TaxID=5974 RepID=A0A8J8TA01_HALGN|nr:hypothetical protein FGO68_gene15383 [Halteria grandinella]